eukprot:TRINITY_DN10913_c0_g1_i2.p1 TRINITY_DN10913_c0_g1~~TRINITY_DN10913_c0_g1_i2.p1  ORF type:complete len:271 (-),score=49.47 TRINITY_DN10913_c0_g1_i2:247-1059(-)
MMPHQVFVRLARQLNDEDVGGLHSSCQTLVSVLFEKQYRRGFQHQRLIPNTEYSIWDGRECAGEVLSAVHSGSILKGVKENSMLRANLFTFAAELRSHEEDLGSLHVTLSEAIRMSTAPNCGQKTSGVLAGLKDMQMRFKSRFLLGHFSKEAFCKVFARRTSLSEGGLEEIFELLDDGTGHAKAEELQRLLNSASETIPVFTSTARKLSTMNLLKKVARMSRTSVSSQRSAGPADIVPDGTSQHQDEEFLSCDFSSSDEETSDPEKVCSL